MSITRLEWTYNLSLLVCNKLLPRERRDNWHVNESDGTRTHNRLGCTHTLSHLAKLASLTKLLVVLLQTLQFFVQAKLQWRTLLSFFYLDHACARFFSRTITPRSWQVHHRYVQQCYKRLVRIYFCGISKDSDNW